MSVTPRIRTLLVDDAEDLRLLLRLALEASGRYQIVGEAGDGHEGLAVAAQTEPDLVLVDLSMPRMDGLEMLPRLRAALPEARVVVLSAFGATAAASQAQRAGADAYLEKGLAPDELIAALDAVGGDASTSEPPTRALRPDVALPPVHEVVGRLAHDLRSPIAVAVGAIGTVRRQVPIEDPTLQDLMRRAEEGLQRLEEALEAAVDYATQGAAALDLQALDLRSVFDAVLKQVAEGGNRIHLEVLTNRRVVADPAALLRVLSLLVDNALRYSGGIVEVSARLDGGVIVLEVADRGPGLGEETAALFRPFVRGSASRGVTGNGLGLATAADLGRRMAGELWARDRDGGGAVFALALPVA